MRIRTLAAVLAAASATGCAEMPAANYAGVQNGVSQRLNLGSPSALSLQPSPEAQQRARELLAEPLTPASAVQLALLQSAELRAELAGLGVAQAELVQAGLISNPRLAVAALRPEGGGRWQLDLGLSQSLLDLLTRPLRRSLAQAEYERAQLQITDGLVSSLQEVQQAYFEALSAQHRAAILGIIAEAAETSGALAARFRDAGNLSELEQLLESTEALRRRLDADAARAEFEQAKRRLATLLGVAAVDAIVLPEQLPDLPDENFQSGPLVVQALQQRLDLQIAQQSQRRAQQALALYGRYRGMTELDVGIGSEREPEGESRHGAEVSLSLPIFDQGQARLAGAEAELRQAVAGTEALKLKIAHEVGEALTALAAQRDLAQRLRGKVIPQRERIVELTQQNYNFMLVGAFQVLVAKQQEYEAYLAYVEALSGYWTARVRLTAAVGGGLPVPDTVAAPLPTAQPTSAMDHSKHGGQGGRQESMDHSQHGTGHEGMRQAPPAEPAAPPPEPAPEPQPQAPEGHEHHHNDGGAL